MQGAPHEDTTPRHTWTLQESSCTEMKVVIVSYQSGYYETPFFQTPVHHKTTYQRWLLGEKEWLRADPICGHPAPYWNFEWTLLPGGESESGFTPANSVLTYHRARIMIHGLALVSFFQRSDRKRTSEALVSSPVFRTTKAGCWQGRVVISGQPSVPVGRGADLGSGHSSLAHKLRRQTCGTLSLQKATWNHLRVRLVPGISNATSKQIRLGSSPSTGNHTSEAQLKRWDKNIDDPYDSPLSSENWGTGLTRVDFTQELRGVNGGHAETGCRLLQEWTTVEDCTLLYTNNISAN
ncbi:uncharacterized protein EDB91DRAFT_1077062 [Suillus paluster]|uniref:uncharacterized protein n=1 Tax=Suillus paluster TaxID=48578 RepID=UPI001B8744D4|nr:uncharacterized protein EDB91DRAFT_1077062 [Suillus paluster]KAG1755039.1 hypothetical protein EDB91DRAFT_1077062 [Suillus paluster]